MSSFAHFGQKVDKHIAVDEHVKKSAFKTVFSWLLGFS